MQWSEPAFVLSFRPFGENDARVHVFSGTHGRFAGVVRGGQSSRKRNEWQPGHLVGAQWRARLLDHMGSLTGEVIRDYSAGILHQPLPLSATIYALTLVDCCTPEREALLPVFEALEKLLPMENTEASFAEFVRFEETLLSALGYGLDLSSCALTYTRHDLAFVSPKTGRAVSRDAAAPWAGRLLTLPAFMNTNNNNAPAHWEDIEDGLKLTGTFIERHLCSQLSQTLQTQLISSRQRLLDLVAKRRKVAANAA